MVLDDKDIPDSDGWTLQALRYHVGERIAQLDRLYEQRFNVKDRAVETALTAQKEVVAAALAAAERAVLKAEAASERRFESENEFGSLLTAQSATLATKAEVEKAIKGLIDKIDGPSGVAIVLDKYMSRHSGIDEETTAAKIQRNQSMRAAAAIGVSALAVTISIISLLTPATRVVYQQPPQIGTPVKPN